MSDMFSESNFPENVTRAMYGKKNIKLIVNLLQNQYSSHCAIHDLHVHVHAYIRGGLKLIKILRK